MRGSPLSLLVVSLLLIGFSALVVTPGLTHGATTAPVTGSITGPSVLALHGGARYSINATGGPAVSPVNGSIVGNLTWHVSVTGSNLTGVSFSPGSAAVVLGKPGLPFLSVGNVTETLTLHVMISSVYKTQNESINLTYSVDVVRPYIVTATLVAGPGVSVLSFPVVVELDGVPVGTVTVPTLMANSTYNLSFSYATVGLSAGDHTFTISLVGEHGLVTFAGGATLYSETFYIPGPAPDYTLWYVAGAVAFLGARFIIATRLAARRRGTARR